jgi:hypothetical protein
MLRKFKDIQPNSLRERTGNFQDCSRENMEHFRETTATDPVVGRRELRVGRASPPLVSRAAAIRLKQSP